MDMEYIKFMMNNHVSKVTDQHIESMKDTLIFRGTLQKSFTQFHSSNLAPSHLPFYIILIYNSAVTIITYEDLQSSLPANLFNLIKLFIFTSYKLNCYRTLTAILCIKTFICGLCNTFTLQITDLEVLLSVSGMSYHSLQRNHKIKALLYWQRSDWTAPGSIISTHVKIGSRGW